MHRITVHKYNLLRDKDILIELCGVWCKFIQAQIIIIIAHFGNVCNLYCRGIGLHLVNVEQFPTVVGKIVIFEKYEEKSHVDIDIFYLSSLR